MLLVPPNNHPHSSHTGSSLVEPPQSPGTNHSNRSSPGQPSPPSSPQVKSNTSDPTTNPPHMSGLSEAHYPPPPVSTAASSQPVSGRSPQAPPASLSAPGTPAPTTPTPAPPTTRPSSGGSASGGTTTPVTSNSSSVSVAGGLGSSAGGAVTTGSVGTGGGSGGTAGGLPPAMPVPGPSATPTGGSSGPGQPLHHPLLGYVPHGANKILSRNINGTLSVTAHPSNESELQLYRVLQRANLLNYYDTFISQGGDDVQQLCEAGEEEFLEIMALVGMASKPLHVRRLQKALQEWVSNPGLFLMPLTPPAPPPPAAPASGMPGPQLDVFNVLSTLNAARQHQPSHHSNHSSSSSIQSPRSRQPPPAVGSIATAAMPHTSPYHRPQPYPSPENLTARKSPPTGGVAPQPGSVSPTDYRRVLEAAWALRAAGQQDPRSSPPGGGKVSPPGGVAGRPTRLSTASPPFINSHKTDNLHNSNEGQPFLSGTPVPWFPFLVPVNKL
ncbi:unnamed protein product [Meganyctiphanes norvegica]|uniref:Nab N-terminal domain-containing protein n=1 Tax=Meganyctiphanes norvegica TaxID=48144 RepID=A0AAV2PVD5_MEGNR